MMNVCVVALGKIGLPLAVQIASKGHRVRGADINAETVERVNAGKEPFPGEADLGRRLQEVVTSGQLSATVDTRAAVAESEIVVVVVPLIVDGDKRPDFRALDAATREIGAALRPGTLVSYETTLPIHTTRGRFTPMLEDASGLTVGQDLFVCHSPERVFSGRVFRDLARYPKLLGGVDGDSSRRAAEFYRSVLDFDDRPDLPRPNGVWDLGSAEAAEFAKLMETTYRDVNIALANEFAVYADRTGIDVQAVIDAANSQPFSHIHRPGIAVGGHCIPVYPRFYLSTHTDARLPAVARDVNERMPGYAVERLEDRIGSLRGLRVAVLGAAYRGGVKETAFSGVFPVVDELLARGAVAVVHDPLYDETELNALGLQAFRFGEPCDAAILQADHDEYRALRPVDLPGLRALVDGRAVVDATAWADVPVVQLGRNASTLGDESAGSDERRLL